MKLPIVLLWHLGVCIAAPLVNPQGTLTGSDKPCKSTDLSHSPNLRRGASPDGQYTSRQTSEQRSQSPIDGGDECRAATENASPIAKSSASPKRLERRNWISSLFKGLRALPEGIGRAIGIWETKKEVEGFEQLKAEENERRIEANERADHLEGIAEFVRKEMIHIEDAIKELESGPMVFGPGSTPDKRPPGQKEQTKNKLEKLKEQGKIGLVPPIDTGKLGDRVHALGDEGSCLHHYIDLYRNYGPEFPGWVAIAIERTWEEGGISLTDSRRQALESAFKLAMDKGDFAEGLRASSFEGKAIGIIRSMIMDCQGLEIQGAELWQYQERLRKDMGFDTIQDYE